jgi:hypothetical protein
MVVTSGALLAAGSTRAAAVAATLINVTIPMSLIALSRPSDPERALWMQGPAKSLSWYIGR